MSKITLVSHTYTYHNVSIIILRHTLNTSLLSSLFNLHTLCSSTYHILPRFTLTCMPAKPTAKQRRNAIKMAATQRHVLYNTFYLNLDYRLTQTTTNLHKLCSLTLDKLINYKLTSLTSCLNYITSQSNPIMSCLLYTSDDADE